ncbi:MAG: hypothetical protein QF570_10125 [Myxococcota bacterium]|jgi:hypothetical protein|nr:hypothetical protein [Myxococcota bacterium]
MTMTRRRFVASSLVLGAGAATIPGHIAWADEKSDALSKAIGESPLVYVSPLRSDGSESRCHAEVWFVPDGGDLLVVTDAKRWRAVAIGKGLGQARLWVGDFGVWKKAEGRYLQAPGCDANARLEKDPAAHERALEAFGSKYASAWGSWGPRFEKGLASGERVLIRYTPQGG